jgi:hypothetical protein
MLRFDGDVFLLGTAIPAPAHFSSTKKLATICAQSRQGKAPRRRVIVANSGPYSE